MSEMSTRWDSYLLIEGVGEMPGSIMRRVARGADVHWIMLSEVSGNKIFLQTKLEIRGGNSFRRHPMIDIHFASLLSVTKSFLPLKPHSRIRLNNEYLIDLSLLLMILVRKHTTKQALVIQFSRHYLSMDSASTMVLGLTDSCRLASG